MTDGSAHTDRNEVAGALDSLEARLMASSHGDTLAFARLYDSMAPRVFGLALRILKDVERSEEVTHEVFLEVWKTCSRFDPNRGAAL